VVNPRKTRRPSEVEGIAMNDQNRSIAGFAEVFRHELGAIMDRRRAQRIEALASVGAEGDYSRTTVQWATRAADEEVRLAGKAAHTTSQALKLARRVKETHAALEQARAAGPGTAADHLRKVSEQARGAAEDLLAGADKQKEVAAALGDSSVTTPGLSDPGESLPGESPPREDASEARLRDYARAAAADLGQRVPEALSLREAVAVARKTAETMREYLWRARVFRRCEAGQPLRGTLDELERKASFCQLAHEKAINARKGAWRKARQLIAADAADRAAEMADTAWEVWKLLAPEVTRPEARAAIASEALTTALVATRAAARAAWAAVRLPEGPDSFPRDGLRALAAVVEALRAAANGLDQNSPPQPHPPEVQALHRRLAEGMLATAADAATTLTFGCTRAVRVQERPWYPEVLLQAAGVVTALREILLGTKSFQVSPSQAPDEGPAAPPPWPDLCESAEALTRATRLFGEVTQPLSAPGANDTLARGVTALTTAVEALRLVVQSFMEVKTLPSPPAATACRSGCPYTEPFDLARMECEWLACRSFLILAPADALPLLSRWDADLSRRIVTGAIDDLGKKVIDVVQWAWKAEIEASDTFRSALLFLDNLEKTAPTDTGQQGQPAGGNTRAAAPPEPPPAGPDMEQLRLKSLDMDLVGLAFSGGGIRSATFGLGVLQALSQLRLLRIFDYFSTVSGGGYIGGWLAAWIHREGSLINVEKQLSPSRVEQSRAERTIKEREEDPTAAPLPLRALPVDEEPEPVHHLRAYSRYLLPRPGFFSPDVWTLGSIYLRNLLINLAVLVPFVLMLVLLSRLLHWALTWSREDMGGAPRLSVAGILVYCAVVITVWLYHQRTRLQEAANDPAAHPDGADRLGAGLGAALFWGVAVLVIGALFRFVGVEAGLIGLGLGVLLVVGETLSPLAAPLLRWLGTTRAAPVLDQGEAVASRVGAVVQRTAWAGPWGITLVCTVLLLVVSSLWLFSYSPPDSDRAVRLTGTEAKTLPLRHPGYFWLNHVSPIAEWETGEKFLLTYALAMAILSVLTASRRLLRWLRSWLASRYGRPGTRLGTVTAGQTWKGIGFLLLCDIWLGVALGGFLFLALQFVVWPLGTDSAAIITLGPPALLGVLILADYAEMLLLGSWMNETEREWRSRLGAVLFMLALGWLVFFGATLYLPWALQQVAESPKVRAALIAVAAAFWSGVSGLGAWAGRWLQSGLATRRSLPWLRLLAMLGPPVFLIGLLTSVSALAFILPPRLESDCLDLACNPSECAGLKWLGYLSLSIALVFLFDLSVDVNLFSLHMLYANRLIRGYLGASRRKPAWRTRARGPFLDSTGKRAWAWDTGPGGAPTAADPSAVARQEATFTDLDPADDLPLRQLRLVEPDCGAADEPARPGKGYRGPYPLLNTALNLIADSELASQDRKADSFLLTPDYCGSDATRYAWIPDERTSAYLTLGRAMTISGAAVDPNMGLYQSPQLTALMTILNTRLGWWMQNPACHKGPWTGAGPGAGFLLLLELFGQTDKTSDYVHLSDGGHFENLGVYELIRRRCRFIVVTDVGDDRYAASENLAHLLRLVRTDFGIRIDLDTTQLAEQKEGLSRWHCAIGLIHYEDVDSRAVAGVLVYLRASLTGDESPDIRQYADACPAFPRQTTLDQFFNEAQFESYRALGYHVAQQVFGESAALINRDACDPITIQSEVRALFANVRRRWFPPPPQADQTFLHSAQLFINVQRNLRDGSLHRLRQELYPEVPGGAPPVLPAPVAQAGAGHDPAAEMHMVSEMVQTMEMVWFAMKLDSYHAHPLNRGWMNLFRRWTGSRTFQRYWPFLRAEYSQDFVRFCERALNMVPISAVRERLARPAAVADWLSCIRDMDIEFRQEWASEVDRLGWLATGHYIRDAVAASTAFARQISSLTPPTSPRPESTRDDGRPLVWMLSLPEAQPAVAKRPCGLVCAFPPFRGAGLDLELLVWLRGPYRNIGIGRYCLGPILDDLAEELQRAGQTCRLLVYYPEGGTNRADRLQKALWMNFFFDYQFRSVEPSDPGAVPGVITLAREIGA
jgi:hypothetical protein